MFNASYLELTSQIRSWVIASRRTLRLRLEKYVQVLTIQPTGAVADSAELLTSAAFRATLIARLPCVVGQADTGCGSWHKIMLMNLEIPEICERSSDEAVTKKRRRPLES